MRAALPRFPVTTVGSWPRSEVPLRAMKRRAPELPRLQVRLDQYVLEYATPRAGDQSLLAKLPPSPHIGFGVVYPRTSELEDPAAIAARVRALARTLGHERSHLNPDCGFGTFAERPMNSAACAADKVRVLAEAARLLRG